MSLAMKEKSQVKKSVTKKEFEKSYIELMDNIRIIDQKLSTKADEVVLTMTLAHKQEIEELQTEIIELHQELKKVKRAQTRQERNEFVSNFKENNPFKILFKKMQFARK